LRGDGRRHLVDACSLDVEGRPRRHPANLGRYTELENKGYATPQLSDTQKAQVAQL
jgi:hypothetical protein